MILTHSDRDAIEGAVVALDDLQSRSVGDELPSLDETKAAIVARDELQKLLDAPEVSCGGCRYWTANLTPNFLNPNCGTCNHLSCYGIPSNFYCAAHSPRELEGTK